MREPLFEFQDRIVAFAHVGGARHPVVRLELLDRVAGLRDRDRLPHDRIQIDEHVALEQRIDLGFASIVARPELA
jgi:hypothetical protein